MPEPGPGAVVIRVRAAPTCGTDLKAYTARAPQDADADPLRARVRGRDRRRGAGRHGLGGGRRGDGRADGAVRRVLLVRPRPGRIVRRDHGPAPPGAPTPSTWNYPRYIVRQNLYPKPPDLPLAEAALLEPLASVVRGQRALTLRPDDTVLIIGAGPIALLHMIALARRRGVAAIHVSGRHAARLAMAAALGATVYDADTTPAGGDPRGDRRARADVVIECTGQAGVWAQSRGLGAARRAGLPVRRLSRRQHRHLGHRAAAL